MSEREEEELIARAIQLSLTTANAEEERRKQRQMTQPQQSARRSADAPKGNGEQVFFLRMISMRIMLAHHLNRGYRREPCMILPPAMPPPK